jgi:hypothetical protein
LNGSFVFSALAEASYAPGDEVVLIESTDGFITGGYLQFKANLPQGLTAFLSYTANQLIMNIAN